MAKETGPTRTPGSAGPDSIARLLRAAREARGLTTREVAARIGVSPAFVSLIETGRKRPSPENARALAEVLAVPAKLILAWVELGGRYEEKTRATLEIARYLGGPVPESEPEQARPRARASLMFSRLLGRSGTRRSAKGPPEDPAGIGLAYHRHVRIGDAARAGELAQALSAAAGRRVVAVPLLPERADPRPPEGAAPEPIDTVMVDRALLPAGTSLEEAWAYRLSAEGTRHAPEALAPGDVVILAPADWPPVVGDVYVVRLHGAITLSRLAVKGDSLVALLAGGVELLPIPSPTSAPPEVCGKVALVVRGTPAPDA